MTVSPQPPQLAHPAFAGLSEAGQQRLAAALELVEFGIGQDLCSANLIPHRILMLEAGKARLLGRQHGQLSTLAAFGPGAVVGLASLLRAQGCEEVTASTPVRASAIPDALVLELYGSEPNFRQWCNTTLFPAELAALLEQQLQRTERSPFGVLDVLSQAAGVATLVPASAEALRPIDAECEVFVASANSAAAIGDQLDSESALPEANGPLPLRLISLPTNLMAELRQGRQPLRDTDPQATPEPATTVAGSSNLQQLHPSSLQLGLSSLRDTL